MTLWQPNIEPWFELFTKIDRHFDVEELRTLCFRLEDELGIDYSDLGGEGGKGKARELVRHCKRHDKAGALLIAVRELRPKIDWPKFFEPTQVDTFQKATVAVKIEIANLPPEKLEALLAQLAGSLQISSDDLSVVQVESGSVVAALEMFAEDAAWLMTGFRRGDESLVELEQDSDMQILFAGDAVEIQGFSQRFKSGMVNLHRANLSLADLSGADLNGADLSYADLSGADLSGANLRRANLRKADLHGAKLGEANLRKADLRKAKLNWADLRRADLRGAKLNGAKLSRADLRRAKLSQAALIRFHLLGKRVLR